MVQLSDTVTVTATVDDEPIVLSAGDTLIVPAHAVHRVENTGEEPAEWLLATRAGVRYFCPTGQEVKPAFIV